MQKMGYMKFIILSSVCFLMIMVPQYGWAAIRYVDVGAAGLNNGTSWDDAYTSLQSALSAAGTGDEIWVAEGMYKPSVEYRVNGEAPNPRYRSFQMKNGVGIYGGFAGTETSRGQRNPTLHVTILSGDIGTVGNNTDNCYHVFYHPETVTLNSTAILDGFTISDGYANGTELVDLRHSRGAGMHNMYSSATIANCIFKNNIVTETGGAMYNTNCTALTLTNSTFSNNSVTPTAGGSDNSVGGAVYNVFTSATFTNCTFTGNTAYGNGGGMFSYKSTITLSNSTFSNNVSTNWFAGAIFFDECSTSTLSNCTIANNSAKKSGGIHNYMSSPTLTDCTISGNSAQELGGGMGNNSTSAPTLIRTKFLNNSAGTSGGAMLNTDTSHPTIINCTFSGNFTANGNGGALWNYTTGAEMPQIINATFYGNTASMCGGAIFNQSSNPAIINSILWGDSSGSSCGAEIYNFSTSAPVVTYSDVQGGWSGTGNLNANPLFVDFVNKDFHLQPTSPCIDRGNNAASNLPTTDFEGDNRIIDGDQNGTATVDMGVDEVTSGNSYLLWTK